MYVYRWVGASDEASRYLLRRCSEDTPTISKLAGWTSVSETGCDNVMKTAATPHFRLPCSVL
jgi:hypothetical protein